MAKRVSVTGNGRGKLAAWKKLFDNAPGLLDAISKSGADEMLGLVSEGFRAERDPYGKPWKPKRKPDGRKVLSGKTSRLKKWQRKKADKHGFTIAPTVDYAAYHQRGTKHMVSRKMVPDATLGLPGDWEKALEEVTIEACKAYFTTASGAGAGMGFSPVASTIAAFKRNNLNVKALIRKLANAGEE